VKKLCEDLRLDIDLDDENQIHISLSNDLLEEITICYQVNEPILSGGSRRYQLREATVIAMRRLVAKAMEEGLISGDPGPPTSLNIGLVPTKPVAPNAGILFMTGEDS
jgi:hypothetical protein